MPRVILRGADTHGTEAHFIARGEEDAERRRQLAAAPRF
jgi:hypothetical protein